MTLAILGGCLFLLSQQNSTPEAHELLARGIQMLPSKPAEAVKVLQQALRLDPELPTLRYELGLALHAIGDEADAETELREAVSRAPDSPEAHNYLGIVLFQMGNGKAALEEFRLAAKLAPKDSNAHFNLGEALARTGESKAALEELRIAAGLTPSDTGLARLVKAVETALAPENTIKVDVRQVLVPAVVKDREGHHVAGLTQADFKVFEDGVEQKITGFSVESANVPQAAIPVNDKSAPTASSAVVPPAAIRRTYLICIDTLHVSFNNFASVREALVKLFEREHSDDSQYVVVALGASAEMVVNVTHDPAAVLAVFQSKRMQKIFLDGQQGGLKAEMERFQRDLVQIRDACNLVAQDKVFQGKCETGMARANLQSTQLAELERTLTTGFLREFRALITQLARARDRRTVVLISDGFGVEPGREPYALLNAYFPFGSHCLVPPTVNCPRGGMTTAVRMQGEFEPILRLAARSNITIDTIDSRGLYGQKAFDASSSGNPTNVDGAVGSAERSVAAFYGNTLAEIAGATGGTAFHDSNDLLGGLERAFADGRDYYTIAYVSSNANIDGKFRAITVQVRDRKVVVNAKRGYWAAQ
jgi:VWFA-related protein